MATMNVQMGLSLIDTASPQVRAFIGVLTQLEGIINGLSAKLADIAGGISGIGGASNAAQSGIAGLATTMQTASLEAQQLALNAIKLEGSLAGAGASAAVAQAEIGGIGNAAAASSAKLGGLGTTLKGLTELWAAFKIEHGRD